MSYQAPERSAGDWRPSRRPDMRPLGTQCGQRSDPPDGAHARVRIPKTKRQAAGHRDKNGKHDTGRRSRLTVLSGHNQVHHQKVQWLRLIGMSATGVGCFDSAINDQRRTVAKTAAITKRSLRVAPASSVEAWSTSIRASSLCPSSNELTSRLWAIRLRTLWIVRQSV